jgi:hypothetical protein
MTGKHVSMATRMPMVMDMHPTIEELLESMFSVQSMLKLYSKDE